MAAWSAHIFAKYDLVRRVTDHTIIPALNLMGLAFEGAGLSSNDQVAGNYSVLAQR
jgi:hypothetical protein